jgi:RimJ/RimL family protein N-acetyltransferase
MNFRLAQETDLPQLAALRWDFRAELHGAPAGETRETFAAACLVFLREALAGGRWAFWIAEQEGQVIAHVCVQRIRKLPRPGRLWAEFGYITNVYTRPEHRNQGIGAELMRRVQAWGQQEKLEMFILWPSQRSGPFYRRAGFIPSAQALEYSMESNS